MRRARRGGGLAFETIVAGGRLDGIRGGCGRRGLGFRRRSTALPQPPGCGSLIRTVFLGLARWDRRILLVFGLTARESRVILAARDGIVGCEILDLVLCFHVAGLDFADQFPQGNGLGEVAALLVQTGQGAVETRIERLLVPSLFQNPDAQVEQSQLPGSLGHVHLGAHIPGIPHQNAFAVFQHLEVIARPESGLHTGANGPAD